MAAPIARGLLWVARSWGRLEGLSSGTWCIRRLALAAAPSESGSPWRLWGALCLQRPPVISKPLTPLQEDIAALLKQIEVERSLYSDHELRALDEARRLARKKADLGDEEDDKEILLVQDLEEMWEQAFLQFKLGARITEADEKNDRTSLHRKLDSSLILLVREKLGEQDFWMLPQAEWQPGETLRATAERTLATLSENNIEAKFLGNAPCGYYKFKFPRAMQTETNLGVKIFFFKALLQTGDFSQPRKKGQHVWVSKDELGDYLMPKYLAQVKKFVLDL